MVYFYEDSKEIKEHLKIKKIKDEGYVEEITPEGTIRYVKKLSDGTVLMRDSRGKTIKFPQTSSTIAGLTAGVPATTAIANNIIKTDKVHIPEPNSSIGTGTSNNSLNTSVQMANSKIVTTSPQSAIPEKMLQTKIAQERLDIHPHEIEDHNRLLSQRSEHNYHANYLSSNGHWPPMILPQENKDHVTGVRYTLRIKYNHDNKTHHLPDSHHFTHSYATQGNNQKLGEIHPIVHAVSQTKCHVTHSNNHPVHSDVRIRDGSNAFKHHFHDVLGHGHTIITQHQHQEEPHAAMHTIKVHGHHIQINREYEPLVPHLPEEQDIGQISGNHKLVVPPHIYKENEAFFKDFNDVLPMGERIYSGHHYKCWGNITQEVAFDPRYYGSHRHILVEVPKKDHEGNQESITASTRVIFCVRFDN